jgi:hypothetical protein
MSLGYSFRKAGDILHRLPPDSREVLFTLCRKIQDAERSLNAAAALRLQGCLANCQGLCCRNLDLGAVFGIPDFVYLLTLAPTMASGMTDCLRQEEPLFTSNCLFLHDGVGPCIFPPDVRPEVCITTFCRGDEALKPQIRQVKKCFWKLGFFLWSRRIPGFPWMLLKSG